MLENTHIQEGKPFIAALAVIVEDEATGKKRVIHGVRVNRRVLCRDKLREETPPIPGVGGSSLLGSG